MIGKTKDVDNTMSNPIVSNKIIIKSSKFEKLSGGLKVSASIMNEFSSSIGLKKTSFLILNFKNELIAYKEVDLQVLKVIPSNSSKTFDILFDKSNLYNNNFDLDELKIEFDTSNIIKDVDNIQNSREIRYAINNDYIYLNLRNESKIIDCKASSDTIMFNIEKLSECYTYTLRCSYL